MRCGNAISCNGTDVTDTGCGGTHKAPGTGSHTTILMTLEQSYPTFAVGC